MHITKQDVIGMGIKNLKTKEVNMLNQIKTLFIVCTIFITGCNPFNYMGKTETLRLEIIGQNVCEAWKVKIPEDYLEEVERKLDPYKYIEYYPDGRLHVYYKMYFFNLSVTTVIDGFKFVGDGYGITHGNKFSIDLFFKSLYRVPEQSHKNVVVNVIVK
jgi:hypothetical protein